MPEFFDFIFKEIGEDKTAQTIIVGDSLTSDILGGVNANISTCWFNVRDKKNMTAIEPDYEKHDLAELEYIVD